MDNLQRRLRQYAIMDEDSWRHFAELEFRQRVYADEEDIIRIGDATRTLFVIQSGWAIRHRALEDGRRQIVNFMLPGDIFDLQALADLDADHTVTAIDRVKVHHFEAKQFLSLLRRDADLASAFWWAAVQEESILREQIVRVGRRSARERIGHLLLELQRRVRAIDPSVEASFPLPVSRAHLADALGLTIVHVSRTISAMKRADLIAEREGQIEILDQGRLKRLSQFDDEYLHNRRLDFQALGSRSNITSNSSDM